MLDRRILKTNGIDMTFDVIDADQRFVQRERHRLRVRNAHQQRTNQARSDRDRDAVDLFFRQARARERLFDDRNDLVEVFARSKFGNHAAKALVSCNLRGNHGRDDLAAITHERSRGLIAGSFDSEYQHLCKEILPNMNPELNPGACYLILGTRTPPSAFERGARKSLGLLTHAVRARAPALPALTRLIEA